MLKDKVPPHNAEAEQAVLGALLLDWNAATDIVTILRADRFYSLQNQIIYQAMLSLLQQKIKRDNHTVIKPQTKDALLLKAGRAA